MVKQELIDAVRQDYPQLPADFITLLLEIHEKDPDYVEGLIKSEKNRLKTKRPPEPKTRLTAQEMDELNAKFQETQAALGLAPQTGVPTGDE